MPDTTTLRLIGGHGARPDESQALRLAQAAGEAWPFGTQIVVALAGCQTLFAGDTPLDATRSAFASRRIRSDGPGSETVYQPDDAAILDALERMACGEPTAELLVREAAARRVVLHVLEIADGTGTNALRQSGAPDMTATDANLRTAATDETPPLDAWHLDEIEAQTRAVDDGGAWTIAGILDDGAVAEPRRRYIETMTPKTTLALVAALRAARRVQTETRQ